MAAQEKGADSAAVSAIAADRQVVAAGVAIFFSFVGTVLLLWTLWESRKANAISRAAYLADQRPWISVKPAMDGDLTFHETMPMGSVRVTVTNVGKSPAEGIEIDCRLVVGGDDFSETVKNSAARMLVLRNQRSTLYSDALFPNESLSVVHEVVVASQLIRQAIYPTHGREGVALTLIVTVLYKFKFQEIQPVTAKAYRLLRSDGDPANMFFLDEKKIVGDALLFEARMGSFIE